jgi:hypothetical protein
MVLMQSRVRDNESTTANIGSMDGGAASGSDAASDFGPRNSIAFCITRFPNQTKPIARGSVAFMSICTDPSNGFHPSEALRRLA